MPHRNVKKSKQSDYNEIHLMTYHETMNGGETQASLWTCGLVDFLVVMFLFQPVSILKIFPSISRTSNLPANSPLPCENLCEMY